MRDKTYRFCLQVLFRKFLYPPPYGGSPPAKFPNYPCFGNELPKRIFFKKISLIRKFISENTSWGVRSEMNIRKHLMGGEFGSSFPNYAETVFFFYVFS